MTGIVERFLPGGAFGHRSDLFNFIDIIHVHPERGIVAVQSCGQDFSGHAKKMTEECAEAVKAWLKHAPVELIGWRKKKQVLADGSKGNADRWFPRIADVLIHQMTGELMIVERKETEQ
jgi:hypothetical protein